MATLDRIVYGIIGERRDSGVDREDLLSLLLGLRDDDGAPMPDLQLRDEVVTLFIGGFETTSIGFRLRGRSMSWRRSRRWITRSGGTESGGGRSPGDGGGSAAVGGAGRFREGDLAPVFPGVGDGREATEPTEICGHRIAVDDGGGVVFNHIHRDAR